MPRVQYREDSGFTLVEMMVSTIILSAIIAPLTASVLLGLLTVTQSQSRVTHSADEQLLAAYFATDVQSAATVKTGSYCSGAGAALVVQWTDPQTSVVRQIAYVVDGNELTRVVCVDGIESRRLAAVRALTTTTPVTITCATAPPAFAVCPTSASTSVRQVKITVTEAGESFQASDYTFSLLATRRVDS